MKKGILGRLFLYRDDSLAVQSAVLIAARWVGFALSFAIPIVLVRVFSQAEFGIYKQLFLISGTMVPVLNLGLTASLFYFVPRDSGEGQRYVVQALGVLSVLGVVAGIALALGAGPISRVIGGGELASYLRILAIFVMVATPSDLFVVSLPVVDRRPAVAGAISATSDVVRAASVVGAALVFRNVEAVVWVSIAVAGARAVWLLNYIRMRTGPSPVRPNLPDLRAQLTYSLPFAAAVVFEVVLMRLHEYYVATHVAPADFAQYAVGVFQVPLLGIVVQSVVEVMLVRIAGAAKVQDSPKLQSVWTQVVTFLSLVLIPCWVAAQVWASDLIAVLFGPPYLPAVPVFRIFLTMIPLMAIVDHGILRATGDTRFLLRANGVGLVVSGAAIFVLGRQSVFFGAVTGLVLGVVVMRVMGLMKVKARLGVTFRQLFPFQLLGRILVAAGASALVALPTHTLSTAFGRLFLGSAVFGVVYGGITWLGWLVDREDLSRTLRRIIDATRSAIAPAPSTVNSGEAVFQTWEPEGGVAKPSSDGELIVIVTIDTEEDNWERAREGVTCRNIDELPQHHESLRALGVRPTYLVTHQVAIVPWAAEILRNLDYDGGEVGTQLHPWNTPPATEPFIPRLSMTKNLPPDLQRQKIVSVTESVGEAIGRQPRCFRTGRWGFGPDTARCVADTGYLVDSSVIPYVSWEDVDDGPSFVGAPMHVYRLDGGGDVRVPVRAGSLLEIPASCGFSRTPFERWSRVYGRLSQAPFRVWRLPGIAARSGLVRRIMLSPETSSLRDMLTVSECLVEEGAVYLNICWHSPTVVPGLTPFAKDQRAVDRLFGGFQDYLESLDARWPLRFATLSEAAELLSSHALTAMAAGDLSS